MVHLVFKSAACWPRIMKHARTFILQHMHACVLSCFSHVWLFVTPWTVARQAPLSKRFSRQESWSDLPCPPSGDLPYPRIELLYLLHWQECSLPLAPPRKPPLQCISSVQLLSHVRLCDSMNRSMPGLPVHHQLPEFTQTHVHRVGDATQPSRPLPSPSPPAPNPS